MAASGTIVQRAYGLVVTALVAVSVLAACGDTNDEPAAGVPQSSPGTEDVAAELTAQRAIWKQAGVDTYEFTMSYYVFSGLYGDYRISVVDGETVSLVREDGSELDSRLSEELPGTIDALFDRLERSASADNFVAEYDSELGYPRSVLVDHMVNAVDDELEVRVTSLTPAAG